MHGSSKLTSYPLRSLSGCPRVSVETKKELMRREVEIKLACSDNAPEVGPKPIKIQAGQRKFKLITLHAVI